MDDELFFWLNAPSIKEEIIVYMYFYGGKQLNFKYLIYCAGALSFLGLVSTHHVEASAIEDYAVQQLEENHFVGKVKVVKNCKDTGDGTGFGYADYSKKIKNSQTNVLYPSASLQKVMTGSMIVQIITESQSTKSPLSQYTKISRFFPNLKGADKITIGQLMTQTGGIDDPDQEVDTGKVMSEKDAVEATISRINKYGLKSQGVYRYNNDNYILLAGILRRYTGKSYTENLQNRIIKPLGLKNTFMWEKVPTNAIRAVSYLYNNGKNYQNPKLPSNSLLSYIVGAGNLYTTPEDYYTFQKGLSNGKVLNQSDFEYLTNLKTAIEKNGQKYSGGMYIQKMSSSNGEKYKMAYGNLARNHYANWFKLTNDNGNGIIVFLNQVPNNVDSVSGLVKSVSQKIIDYSANYDEPSAVSCSRYLTVMKKGQTAYNNLTLTQKRQSTSDIYQKTFLAKRYYVINGIKYYSLYDNNNQWEGYVSEKVLAGGKDNTPAGKHFSDSNRYALAKNLSGKRWSNFNFSSTKGTLSSLKGQLVKVDGYYNHFNGNQYLSLYNYDDKWLGYVDARDVTVYDDQAGPYHSDPKYVTIWKNNYTLWRNLDFDAKKGKSDSIYQKTLLAKGYYDHFNGERYLTLYDKDNQWYGYINAKGVRYSGNDGKDRQGAYIGFNKPVQIVRDNYTMWNGFEFDEARNITNQFMNQTLYAQGKYSHFNGSTYYSIYNNSNADRWLGYLNSTAVKIK